MTPAQLEEGYRRAYRDFYRWGSILRGAAAKPDWAGRARHAAYAIGWKKCEPAWDALIRARRVGRGLPLLERVLAGAPKAGLRAGGPAAAGRAGTTRAVLSAPRGSARAILVVEPCGPSWSSTSPRRSLDGSSTVGVFFSLVPGDKPA